MVQIDLGRVSVRAANEQIRKPEEPRGRTSRSSTRTRAII